MKQLWLSLREYVFAVAKPWWQLAVGFVGAGFAVATAFKSGLLLPTWVGIAVAIGALTAAQFTAFHRIRIARDEAAAPFAPAPWIVNEFSGGTYWPHHLAGYIEMSGHGLAVRIVVGPREWDLHARISKPLRESLRTSLADSAFESWLTGRANQAPWNLRMPTGPHIANVERVAPAVDHSDATYSAFALFQLPTSPQSPRAVLAVDLVFAPEPTAQPTPQLTLADVHELCLALLTTAIDQVAPKLFPAVEPQRRRLRRHRPVAVAGPSVYLCAPNGRTLGDYIDLSQLHQVKGARQENIQQVAAIELPFGQRLDGLGARDQFVRNGLKTLLEGSAFIDGDEYVDALPTYEALGPQT